MAIFKVADAVVALRADMSELNRNLGDAQRTVKKTMGNILGTTKDIGIGMTAVGASIVGALGIATKASAESEQAQAQLAAVIKSTGGAAGLTADELNKMALGLSRTTTYEDDAITSGQSLLLTFTNIGKDVFPQATAAMLDMSTSLGQDMKSSAIQLGKALNDPIKGITALSRVGVSFTEQQKEQIKVLVESGDVMGAQKVILAELAKEFGGSAAAQAQTLTGQLLQLKNEFGNLLEEIGNALTNGNGFKGLIENIKLAVIGVTEWIKANPELTSTLVTVAAVVGGLFSVLGPFLVILPGLVTAFAAVGPVVTFVGGVLAAVAGVISGPVLLAIGALVAAGVALYMGWDYIKAFAITAWGAITDVVGGAMAFMRDGIERDWNTITGLFNWALEGIVDVASWAWNGVVGIFRDGWDWITGMFYAGVDGVVGAFYWCAGALSEIGNVIWRSFTAPLDAAWYGIQWLWSLFNGGAAPGGGTPMGGRASGGPVEANTPYMVNERGIEYFIPDTAGFVLSNSDTTDLFSSIGTMNQTGTSTTNNTNASNSVSVNGPLVNVASIVIREDADIERVSREIARTVKIELAGALA